MIIIERCKRELYIDAWLAMYKADKVAWNQPMFDGVNPSLNKKPLETEIDNFCVVAYDSNRRGEKGFEDFPIGVPVGIFSFVITPRKNIGKQYVVHPDYQGRGIGQALLIEAEKMLLENGFDRYYIGCSQYSAGIFKKHWGIEPFSSDPEHDMYKFNVDLKRDNFNELYKRIIEDNPNVKVVDMNWIVYGDGENEEAASTENQEVSDVNADVNVVDDFESGESFNSYPAKPAKSSKSDKSNKSNKKSKKKKK